MGTLQKIRPQTWVVFVLAILASVVAAFTGREGGSSAQIAILLGAMALLAAAGFMMVRDVRAP